MTSDQENVKHKSRRPLSTPTPRYTQGLPILDKKEEILASIKSNQVIIIAGETGSGKTTQLPVICLEAGRGKNGKIGCTQPRRIAATSIGRRVAQELQCTLGVEVGYKVRFNDKDSPETSIKFMTDGILLAEIQHDPLFLAYDTIIIDEAHERSLNIDFLLGYLRKILPRRPDLKLIISSATMDTQLFSKAFNNAPIVEVSGRLYPVELLYLSEDAREDDEGSYVDAAVRACGELIDIYGPGDMLVFMPTERDIRETCRKIKGLKLHESIIVPLFSRLSLAEQETVFKKLDKRKIVVATNIAETSITIPGIRFVVDTGLARTSRYVPRLRTNRLPIEPVSAAAADQRKGRCGRVRDGVCIRLYTEKEYLSREKFTLPEIRRSDLAGVILTMTAQRLGRIEEFPFIEPPAPQAVSDGYAILKELGAIDDSMNLTPMGRQMARLPIDPHIARMILQARDENALREVKIIAAALSIVDPRERPYDKREEADEMQKKFVDPRSDFLSFINLWDAYQNEWNRLETQGNIRKFCRNHFLSHTRMREWHDVHQLICETLDNMRGFVDNREPAVYDAVHRSILPGLLSNCAMKNEEGRYDGARGKEVVIFPGSALSGKGVDWIMCHEIVETSQVFGRTAAVIKPQWIEDIAAHLCKRTYSEPFFYAEGGYAAAHERISFFGLPISEHRNVRYGRINPEKAADVFITQGLVEEQLNAQYGFYKNNVALREEIENAEAKLRSRTLFAGESAATQFYLQRLGAVSSVHELNKIIKEKGSDRFLYMSKEDLLCAPLPEKVEEFPDTVEVGGKRFDLRYDFSPGSEQDGVTLLIPAADMRHVNQSSAGWLVPALWPQRIEELLRSLPKDLRKKFMPINERAIELAGCLKVSPELFEVSLAKAISILYNVEIDPGLFSLSAIAPHLAVRFEVRDNDGNVIASGRDVSTLSGNCSVEYGKSEIEGAYAKYEKYNLTSWTIGDLPDTIEVVSTDKGVPLYGYPALKARDTGVDLILSDTCEEAEVVHEKGVSRLLEIVGSQELAWIEKELKPTSQLKLLCTPFGGMDKFKTSMIGSIRSYLLKDASSSIRTAKQFEALVSQFQKDVKGIGFEAVALLEKILILYNENVSKLRKKNEPRHCAIKKELQTDLAVYMDELTGGDAPFDRLRQFPRYLKAFGFRIDRAFLEPLKYTEKRKQLEMYREKERKISNSHVPIEKLEDLHQSIEEFAISLFAQQEVKTLFPISTVRLDKKMGEIEAMVRGKK